MFEDRQRAADDHGGQNSIADRASALQTNHRPIVGHGRKQIDRANQTEGEREQPDGQANPETGADEFAPPAHLKREIDRGKSTDQPDYQKRCIDSSKENAAPKTDENRGEYSLNTAE